MLVNEIHLSLTLQDVIGVVMETMPSQKITTKAQKETSKRVLKLVDTSSWNIEVTLWGTLAENPGTSLSLCKMNT